jgi:hypothetical protein
VARVNAMIILQDVVSHGILPMEEILGRAHAGTIPPEFLGSLLIARLAEDLADAMADDCQVRYLLLSIVEAARIGSMISHGKVLRHTSPSGFPLPQISGIMGHVHQVP